jgi:hypothetical protein
MAEIEERLRAAIDEGDTTLIDQYQKLMDQAQGRRPKPLLLPSALWYVDLGLHVFPLQPGAKTPYPGTHGCKDATTNPDAIVHWWTKMPTSNIGIATGHAVDVIDIDGPIGVQSWAQLDNVPPILGKVSTPRAGGSHLYVRATGRGNKAGIAPGIDHRGIGGYVVAPPSVNADGVAYAWYQPLNLNDDDPKAAA